MFITILVILVSLIIGWITTTGAKSQFVRLGDIFVFGPFLIWAGFQTENLIARYGLLIFGASTIGYNGRNWLVEEGVI